MGVSRSYVNGRYVLDCDVCGENPARRIRCPFTVTYAEGGSLPMCSGVMCARCRAIHGTKAAHRAAGCEESARKAQAREADKAAKAIAGVYQVISAFGEWHDRVPQGFVGVIATPGGLRNAADDEERFFLVPKATYPLPDYAVSPDAIPWKVTRDTI